MSTADDSSAAASRDAAKLEVLKGALYDACQQNGDESRAFTQRDLLDLEVLPNGGDVNLLMRIVQSLCDDSLLLSVSDSKAGLAWRWRSVLDAEKYRHLASHEQRMLYGMIDDAGADGIWSRTLKARLGMHDSVFKTAMKALESRGFVTQMKSVENVNKKMWIKANLQPSDRATGGPWYTDSDLDEPFILELEMFIFDYVTRRSGYRGNVTHHSSTKQPKKGVVKGRTDAQPGARGRKRMAEAISDDTAETNAAKNALNATQHSQRQNHNTHSHRKEVLLPLPAGYTLYPTVRDIAELIDKSGITNNTTLSEADVQQLVDVLVYDGLIEPVKLGSGRQHGYRTARLAKQDPTPVTKRLQEWRERGLQDGDFKFPGAEVPSNGFVEIPCGQCPVFELCEEGGPVNPSNCVYFQRWLDRD